MSALDWLILVSAGYLVLAVVLNLYLNNRRKAKGDL